MRVGFHHPHVLHRLRDRRLPAAARLDGLKYLTREGDDGPELIAFSPRFLHSDVLHEIGGGKALSAGRVAVEEALPVGTGFSESLGVGPGPSDGLLLTALAVLVEEGETA